MPYFPNYRLGPIDGSSCDTLGINNIPVASFYWEATGLDVGFSNTSYHEPTSYIWDFGDPTGGSGNTSTEVNPHHIYPAPGSYNVCLTAANNNGSDIICKLVTVDTLPAPPVLPVAAFTWDTVGLVASFFNTSYNAPTSYLWDFGEPTGGSANNSTEVNPVHTYPAPGDYSVCLTATNMNGSDTICQWVAVDTLLDTVSLVAKEVLTGKFLVVPNPAASKVSILMEPPLAHRAAWSLYDPLGRAVLHEVLPAGHLQMEVDLTGLPDGLYTWKVAGKEADVGAGKLLILKR
jgi:PKD repeat protein